MMDNTTQVIRTYFPLPLQANVSMSLRIFIFAQRKAHPPLVATAEG
jgi:hypothetical protein